MRNICLFIFSLFVVNAYAQVPVGGPGVPGIPVGGGLPLANAQVTTAELQSDLGIGAETAYGAATVGSAQASMNYNADNGRNQTFTVGISNVNFTDPTNLVEGEIYRLSLACVSPLTPCDFTFSSQYKDDLEGNDLPDIQVAPSSVISLHFVSPNGNTLLADYQEISGAPNTAGSGMILNGSIMELGASSAPGAALTKDTLFDGVSVYSFRLNNIDGFSVNSLDTQVFDTAQTYAVDADGDINLNAVGDGRLIAANGNIIVQSNGNNATFQSDNITTVGVLSGGTSELRLRTRNIAAGFTNVGQFMRLSNINGQVEFADLSGPVKPVGRATLAGPITSSGGNLALTSVRDDAITANASDYEITQSGNYDISFSLQNNAGATAPGLIRITIAVNGNGQAGATDRVNVAAGEQFALHTSIHEVPLSSGDNIQAFAISGTGSNEPVVNGVFTVRRVSDDMFGN